MFLHVVALVASAVDGEPCFTYPSNDVAVCGDDTFPSPMSSYQTYNIYQPVQRPMLILPGVGGSILYAQSKTSSEQHDSWAAYHGDDPSCQTFVDKQGSCNDNTNDLSWFTYNEACSGPPCLVDRFLGMHVNRTTGERTNLAAQTWDILVRDDNFGLCGIDDLDPNLIISSSSPMYFHEMLRYLSCTHGYVQGVNLYAFPYDWRLGPYDANTVSSLADLVYHIACPNSSSACVPIDIVSHSMGGLLFTYLLATNSSIESLVHSWSAIATPFQGSGVASNAFVQGYNFDVAEYVASIKTAHHYMMDWPAAYALLPNPVAKWLEPPTLAAFVNGQPDLKTKTLFDNDYWQFLADVNVNNTLLYVASKQTISFGNSFNQRLIQEVVGARKAIANMKKQLSFPVYILGGNNTVTPHSFTYSLSVANNRGAFFGATPQIQTVNGDGTVPLESAFRVPFNITDGWVFDNVIHMDLVKDTSVFTTIMMAIGRACMWTGQWADKAGHVKDFAFDFPPDDYAPDNGYYDSQADIYYQIDDACTTISLSTTTFLLTRAMGVDCGPKGRKPCSQGGFRRCAYGYWTNDCY